MPNNLTIPSPDIELAKCPHCGASVKINPVWFQKIKAILDYLNSI
jgi:hypothetical protein